MARRTGEAATIIGLLVATMAHSAAAQEPGAAGAPRVGVEALADPDRARDELAEEVGPALREERASLLRRATEHLTKLDGLIPELEGKTGEEHLVLLGQIGRLELEILQLYDGVATHAEESRKAGLDTSELEVFFAQDFVAATPYLTELISGSQSEVLQLSGSREQLPRDQLVEFEEQLAGYNARIDRYYEILLEHAERLERVGLDGEAARAYVRAELPVRADRISGRVQLAREQIRTLEGRVRESPDDSAAVLELRAARIKLAWVTESLRQQARLLDTLGIPTSQYRQLLIRATGNLTQDIFDEDVARGLLDEAVDEAREWAEHNGAIVAFRLLLFVLIVAVSRVLGSFTRRVVTRVLKASRFRTSGVLQEILATIAGRTILLLGVLFGLSQLGVQIGPLLAGIGIIGFAVGFALQDTLSNFASGTMLLIYRPFDVGDVIEAGGVLGTVDHLSLVNTTLLTFDNRKIFIPNNKIWGDVITNITAKEIRRVDLAVGVAHSEKVARVEGLLAAVVTAHPKVLPDPAPLIKVHKLSEASVDFVVRPWARREDYWNVRWDLTRAIKQCFEEEGVELARSRRHVVMETESARNEPPTGDRSG